MDRESGTGADGGPARSELRDADNLVLLTQLARRYYMGHQSKTQIATALGLSRFKVARLLETAVERGVIRFEVGMPGDIDLGLSAELRESYGLSHCVVVDTPDETLTTLREYVGMTASEMLSGAVTDRDILGLSTTRTLTGLTQAPTRFAKCPVVQMTGAISRTDAADVMEEIRRFTRVGGGPAYLYYAPMLCSSAAAAVNCRAQADFQRCQELFDKVTISAVGVGRWDSGLSQIYEACSQRERRDCLERGAHAEVCGLLVDNQGHVLDTPLTQRMVGISEESFRRIRTRIGIAYGGGKREAVRIALRAGLINGLVTHRTLAEEILQNP